MTYGCETWTLTKTIVHKLQVAQRAMERKILGIKITDKIPNEEISVENQYTQHHKTHNEYKMEMGLDMWQECKTIGGQYAQQSGEWGKEEDLGADPKWDGKMTSWSGREQHGRELQKTESSGKNLRRATSSSGRTQPRYKVQGTYCYKTILPLY